MTAKSKTIIDQVAAFEDAVVVRNIAASAEGVQMSPRDGFDRAVTVDYQSGKYSNALTQDERLQLDDRLHYVIHFPQRGMEIPIGSDFAETIIADGDIATLVVMRRDSRFHVTVLDVYRVNTNGYNGRIADLTKPVEEEVRKHGAQRVQRWSRFAARPNGEELLSRWDRNNSVFPAFKKVERDSIPEGTQEAFDLAGIRGNGSRDDSGSDEVTSQQSLRELTPTDWTEQYLERVRPSDIQDAGEADNLRIYQKRLNDYNEVCGDAHRTVSDRGKLLDLYAAMNMCTLTTAQSPGSTA